jgi:tRNA-splicing endonuclease subunit Sen54
MADEDEDLSHLQGPEPAEIDLSDETQDFRFLDKLTYSPIASHF